MNIDFKLNDTAKKITEKVIDKKATSLFMAQTWHRLYYPFIPFGDSEELASNVEFLFENEKGVIHHKVPYAHRQYTGEDFNFKQDKHPLATAFWNRAAETAGKKEILVKEVQEYVDKQK